MLQQSSSCRDSLFALPDFEFRPCLASMKTKNAFSCSMEKHKLLFTSASSSLSLKQQYQTKRNPVLACRASRDPQVTSGKDDAAVHGVADVIVGVLGGGQLGRMLCQAASQMAIKVVVLDPQENCPASEIAHHHMVGSFDDSATVQEFAKRCGVLTVEIEHVDVETLEKLEQQGVDCQPKASTIRIIQDKYLQKVHFSKHDIPLPEFVQIDDLEGAKRAGDLFGYPLMIKSKRLAYDGRGNAVAKSEDELSSAVTALGGFDRGLYVEKWAPFVKELAVIVARGRDNSIACYPVVETIHKENICHIVKAPANMSWKIRKLATDIATRAVRSLEGAGVFAVELFLTKDDQVLLNEVAPRPHNSGHHTIESCYTSQYEQHLRAVVGLPLGDPSMKTPAAIMYNLLGEDEGEPGFLLAQQLIGRALRIPGATVHWYDKPEMRKQRKMGHITIVVKPKHFPMAPIDPHSFTDSTHPLATHISLSFFFDFPSSTIHASALLTLPAPYSGPLSLDIRALTVHSVIDPHKPSRPLSYVISHPDPIKGCHLTFTLSNAASVLILYSTSPSSSALQWLSPPQTFNKTLPFVYTQCHAIHARSVFPCQDTPAARVRYAAKLNVPRQLSAVMSARHVSRRDPIAGEGSALVSGDALWCSEDRVVEEFVMEQPIPPYLFAFAVGELGFREVGPRTRVYSEAVPAVLESAATEFASTEDMIRQGEALFGPYVWERFDLLVLPPSFPYAGMENPRMTFLTPTMLKGDASGARVVAHELAHSWTGNLITNKTNEHFWLNEGFTTYAERRIVEAVQGEDRAALNIGIGWRGLHKEIERFKDSLEVTKLKTNQEGVDPDDVYSRVPYEKGFQFLWRIERQVGRPAFDEFLKKYIATFKFQSIDTETFLEFLKANLPGIEKEVDLVLWTEGTGIPPDAYEPVSNVYAKIVSMANEFKLGRTPGEDEVADWRGQEWELYLENLPKPSEPSQIIELNSRFRLAESKDYDVKVTFLLLAIASKCKDYLGEVERTLKEVGRKKYLVLLYSALVEGNGNEEEKILAKQVFAAARETYHPIAQGRIETILNKHC